MLRGKGDSDAAKYETEDIANKIDAPNAID